MADTLLRALCLASALSASCVPVATAQDTAAPGQTAPPPAAPSAAPPSAQAPLPSLAELQAAGAVIGEIRINVQNVFDPDEPKESGTFYRLVNILHIKTRPSVVERSLLFKRGDLLSVQRIEETERLLRTNAFLYDVSIKPVALQGGVVDLEVKTYDTWSLTASANVSRSGGANTTGLTFQERNFLGTGLFVGLSSSSNPDRKGTEFELAHRHTFGNWNEFSYKRVSYDDGSGQAFSFKRPFYALDTRWAAGIEASSEDSLVSAYGSGGVLVDRYRLKRRKADVFRGWSDGLVNGWTRRYSLGLAYQDDDYSPAPAYVSPELPADQRLVTPYVRLEVVQDNFEKLSNRDQIGRTEYFATGFAMKAQVGRSLTALGSSRSLWDYEGSISDGYVVADNDLLVAAALSGQYGDGKNLHQVVSASAKYYVTHSKHARMFVSAAASATSSNDSVDLLQLGGDNGLRGYPLRYQSGQRRSLLTVEERIYSDVFLLRLFRVGGAVFYDVGRAWGGTHPNPVNPGWLSDVGFGLRIFSVRAAKANVLHLDFAFPLKRDPGIKPFQVLLKTKASF
jgi:outer membrane protein assembly factor BamA